MSTTDGRIIKAFPDFAPPSASGSVEWSADGSAVLYVTAERANIWKQPLAGGAPEKVTNFSELAIVRFVVSPDGRSALLCRGNSMRDAFLMTNFR